MVGVELADTLPKVGGYAGGYVIMVQIHPVKQRPFYIAIFFIITPMVSRTI